MTIEPKDVLTVVAGAVSLSGLYYALKRNVEKLNITVRTMDTHHKREISAIHHRIDEIKIDTKETINKRQSINSMGRLMRYSSRTL